MLFKQQGMNGCSPVLSTHLWYRRADSQEVLPTKLLLLIACLSTDHGFSWFRMFVHKDPLTRGVIQPTQNLQDELFHLLNQSSAWDEAFLGVATGTRDSLMRMIPYFEDRMNHKCSVWCADRTHVDELVFVCASEVAVYTVHKLWCQAQNVCCVHLTAASDH